MSHYTPPLKYSYWKILKEISTDENGFIKSKTWLFLLVYFLLAAGNSWFFLITLYEKVYGVTGLIIPIAAVTFIIVLVVRYKKAAYDLSIDEMSKWFMEQGQAEVSDALQGLHKVKNPATKMLVGKTIPDYINGSRSVDILQMIKKEKGHPI